VSKVPYANEEGNGLEKEEKKASSKKAFFIAFFVSLLVVSLLALGVGFITYAILKDVSGERALLLHIFADATGVAGILGICVFGLTFLFSKGAFDMLSYSVQTLFLNIFRPKYRKEKFPKTFYDFKVIKDNDERKPLYAMLIPAFCYFICGIILVIVYNTL